MGQNRFLFEGKTSLLVPSFQTKLVCVSIVCSGVSLNFEFNTGALIYSESSLQESSPIEV